MEVAWAVALGTGFLYAFYRAVEVQWPASYFVVQPGLLLSVTQSPVRYLLFRFGPIFVTASFIAVTLENADSEALLGVLGLAALHTLLTSARGFRAQVCVGSRQRNPSLLLFHLAVSVGIFVAAIAAYIAAPEFESLVPPESVLTTELWTALLAGVIGAFLVRVSRRSDADQDQAFRTSKARLDPQLLHLAAVAADAHDADPNLLVAIMLVENLERPAWARAIERAKGRIIAKGSYGVMQVSSDKPLTDAESIEIAARDRLSGVVVLGPRGFPVQGALESAARAYNPDGQFVTAVVDAYQFVLSSQRLWETRLEPCPACGEANAVIEVERLLDNSGAVITEGVQRVECRQLGCIYHH